MGYFDDLQPEPGGGKGPKLTARKAYFDDLRPEDYARDPVVGKPNVFDQFDDWRADPVVGKDIKQLSDAQLRQHYLRSLPDRELKNVFDQFDDWRGDPVVSEPGLGAQAKDFGKSMLGGIASSVARAAKSQQIEADLMARTVGTPTSADVGNELPTPEKAAEMIGLSPQGRAGKFGAAVGESLAQPISYIGAGSLPLKLGANALAALASEGAGQATEGTAYETPARLLAGVAAGGFAGRKFGPKAEKAEIPTEEQLRMAKEAGYQKVRASGVEIDPEALGKWAVQQQQELTNGPKYAFTGGSEGTAPKTMGLLDKIQSNSAGATTVTASNLDTVRRYINNIAGETRDFKPTADAKAAMVLKRAYADFLENPPEGAVVAGDAADFASTLQRANRDNAAFERVRDFNNKIANAEETAAGPTHPSLNTTLAAEARKFLKNPKAQRGYTPEEIAAVRGLNRGGMVSGTLNQLGRLAPAGPVTAGLHAAGFVPAAIATGGASIAPQIAAMAALYGARRGGAAMTANRAQNLIDMLAMRSPLYQQRLNALPPPPPGAAMPAALRALAGGL
jgi:hypothetical protein